MGEASLQIRRAQHPTSKRGKNQDANSKSTHATINQNRHQHTNGAKAHRNSKQQRLESQRHSRRHKNNHGNKHKRLHCKTANTNHGATVCEATTIHIQKPLKTRRLTVPRGSKKLPRPLQETKTKTRGGHARPINTLNQAIRPETLLRHKTTPQDRKRRNRQTESRSQTPQHNTEVHSLTRRRHKHGMDNRADQRQKTSRRTRKSRLDIHHDNTRRIHAIQESKIDSFRLLLSWTLGNARRRLRLRLGRFRQRHFWASLVQVVYKGSKGYG